MLKNAQSNKMTRTGPQDIEVRSVGRMKEVGT